jgi:hypothetical protein
MKKRLIVTLLLVVLHEGRPFHVSYSRAGEKSVRELEKLYYYSTFDLGYENPDATAGNPLKGLLGSPGFINFDWSATSIDASMEYYYVGLDELMKANPDVVGDDAAFDWTPLENRLEGAASRNRHVVFTVICHYPGNPLNVPQYLLDAGLKLLYYPDFLGGGTSPDYSDPILLEALRQFITALGARYDGDYRIGFLQLGLLGFWVRTLGKLKPAIFDITLCSLFI